MKEKMKFRNLKKAATGVAVSLALTTGFAGAASAAIGDNEVTFDGQGPKYVFMFIADGLSYGQMGVAQTYLGAIEGEVQLKDLTMSNFPVAGSAATFDSTSFAPDSASTATSLSTGHKTLSGVVNMDETKTTAYETITEKVKDQLGWKVGIVSSVNLNHATPAAYYGHQASRGNYYELTQELIASGFEYFAGGKLLDSRTGDFDKLDVYADMEENGYTVITDTAAFNALTGDEEKLVVISDDKEFTDDTGAMHYELDRAEGQPSLADYVAKGIEVIDNETGFFMMVEGGKVDWAAHANDAASVIADVLAFNEALDEAVAFAEEHPEETLIIVTGDHETGGLSIGFAGTGYDTHLEIIENQGVSFVEYDKNVTAFREDGSDFTAVLADIQENFGLIAPDSEDATEENALLVLSDYELEQIQDAYEKSMVPRAQRQLNDEENLIYGTYEPLTVTITHILNQKAGLGWTSYAHTGLPVPVFAMGVGQDLFEGFYDNTKVFYNLQALTDVE